MGVTCRSLVPSWMVFMGVQGLKMGISCKFIGASARAGHAVDLGGARFFLES